MKTFAPFAFYRCALCVPLLIAAAANAQRCAPQDFIYYNGNILTGVGLHAIDDHSTPQRAQAIAITGGRVAFTGPDSLVVDCADAHTIKIDLHGAFAMPGFNDAHTHIADAGLQRLTANLDGVTSLAEMQSRIAAYAKTLDDPHAWILGGGWDHTKWAS